MNTKILSEDVFLTRVSAELKRAERYRIFVSLIVLDVGAVRNISADENFSLINDVVGYVQRYVRVIDDISLLGPYKVGMLFPETTRQGAEIASKRISELIKQQLSELNGSPFDQVIPLEMASYPDAAGARSIADFLMEYSKQNLN
ncbi:MAG: hypothetical protein JSV52_07470 [Candidatus Zixiibacteriota bacterium]|nr:MAG: hypothetical protein JSV52_07470 [candidate division Zixibacteria bacterium]